MTTEQIKVKAEQEGRLLLVLQACKDNQFKSIRSAAKAYNFPFKSLSRRTQGVNSRFDSRANSLKLTEIEEKVLEERVLSMDERGYPLTVASVREAASILLQQRVGNSGHIGANWPRNFINRHPTLKSRYTRNYDYQRARCEDPEIIIGWFRLVRNTIVRYGIPNEDIYNFDETSFVMGIASTSCVVTTSDRRGRPPRLQTGDREWVTAVETINSKGWSLPPMVIFKGKVHISVWYENNNPPAGWTIVVSENGWTTNALGLHWIQEIFEPNTIHKSVSRYRLLILDGHRSHATPEFDKFCAEKKIITLCMPAHSSHLLQPSDVGCFSVLKRAYGTQVAEFTRLGINHIDKAEFLHAFKKLE